MPRIPDQFLECIFYLYPSHDAAEQAERMGGCGFFLLLPFARAKRNHLYAVTNRHLIDDGNCTLRINTKDGRSFPVDSDERKWHFSSTDDLAILLIDFPFQFECVGIGYDEEQFITEAKIQQHDIGLGDETFVVARFVNHDGKQKNNPIVKFGNIAQMPVEPIRQPTGNLQESYLIEGRTIGGFSGSPVFAYIPPMVKRPQTGNRVTSESFGPWLLGISWGYLIDWTPVCDRNGNPIGTTKVAQNSGMMGVVPIWKLTELINSPKAVATRQAREDEILGKDAPVAMNGAASPDRHTDAALPPTHLEGR